METIWILAAIVLFVAVLAVVHYFTSNQTSSELRSLGESFGSNVSATGGFIGDSVVKFERGGTEFTGKIRRFKYATDLIVEFELPPSDVYFHIQTKAPLANMYVSKKISPPSDDWHLNASSPLSGENWLYSRHPSHLDSLLADSRIVSEIAKFDNSVGQFIDIWSESGRFEVMYHTDGRRALEKLKDVFETAVAFHDRIKDLTA